MSEDALLSTSPRAAVAGIVICALPAVAYWLWSVFEALAPGPPNRLLAMMFEDGGGLLMLTPILFIAAVVTLARVNGKIVGTLWLTLCLLVAFTPLWWLWVLLVDPAVAELERVMR